MKDSNPETFIFSEQLDRAFLDELFEGDSVYAQVVFEDFLRDQRVGFVRIDGTCPTAKRNAMVIQFQEDDKVGPRSTLFFLFLLFSLYALIFFVLSYFLSYFFI